MRAHATLPVALALAAGLLFTPLGTTSARVSAQAGGRERTMFVSAVDSKGEPVEGLTPADFIITEDGRRREVLRVSRAIEPMDIALVVDNSASATQAISSIREGLKSFVATMAEGNAIALVAIADRPTVYVDYTSDPKRLTDGIGRLFAMNASGMTLLDALVEVSTGLQRRETPRAVIVPVITDGTEFTNRYFRDVIAAVSKAGAAVHALAIGSFYVTDDTSRERAFVLDMGTKDTGGQRVTLLADSAVTQALSRLARELSSQYKVVYGRPESLLQPDKIEVSSGKAGVTMRGRSARGQGSTGTP